MTIHSGDSVPIEALSTLMAKPRKFHNEPCERDGIYFDSRKELRRYEKLKLAQDAGVITELEVHPLYRLRVEGIGVEVFRYSPDFSYVQDGQKIVEDVKSKPTKTEAYGIRKRLMRALLGIEIREV